MRSATKHLGEFSSDVGGEEGDDAPVRAVDECQLRRVTIDNVGGFTATSPVNETGTIDVKKAMLALVDVVDALEAAADAPALPAPDEGAVAPSATGSASGAPVGVMGGDGHRLRP